MRALIVEGELMSQCVLAKLLGERGHEVVSFENAEQAILAYQKEFYPLVFVNVDLPGMDGLQFCRWLRSQPEGEKTYIILAMTPRQPEDINQVLTVGASDFLLKPFDVSSLRVRLTVAERHMNSFFHEQDLQAELRRRAEEAEGMQAELCRAGESLVREVELRRKAEDALDGVQTELVQSREAFSRQLQEQAAELCSTADELQSATTFRSKVEEDLKKVRVELEARAGKHAKEAEALRQTLAQEKASHRAVLEEHQKATEHLQHRTRELTAAARKADERRLASEAEGRRAAETFAKAQADWEQRQRDLVAQVNSLRQRLETETGQASSEELEAMTAARDALKDQLTAAREDFARRMEVHTTELLRLDERLRAAQGEHQRLQGELLAAREDLAAKSRDYVAAVLKAGEEVEQVQAQKTRAVAEVEHEFRGLQERMERERAVAEELRTALAGGQQERRELEEELQKAWQELELRPDKPGNAPAELERELAQARQALEVQSARYRELEDLLQRERAQVRERLRRFAAALDGAEPEFVQAV